VSKDEVDSLEAIATRLVVNQEPVPAEPPLSSTDELLDWICGLCAAVTLEPGTLLIVGSARDIRVEPATTSAVPLRLLRGRPGRRTVIRPNAHVVLDMGKVGRAQCFVRQAAE
jgi:hypothetical protein